VNPGILTSGYAPPPMPYGLLGSPRAVPMIDPYVFDPRSVGGLEVWLDAAVQSSYTLDGNSSMQEWRSLTNGYVASQGTANNRPAMTGAISGIFVPTFDGTNDRLAIPHATGLALNSYTILGVVDNDDTNTNYRAWIEKASASTAASRKWWVGVASAPFSSGGVTFNASDICVVAAESDSLNLVRAHARPFAPVLVAVTKTAGTSAALHVNGTLIMTDSSVSDLSNTSDVGIGGSFFPWRGKIASVLIYNSALPASSLSAVSSYLIQRWNVT
jgi:hypothetical protein